MIADRSGSVIFEHILRSQLDHVNFYEIIAVGGWYIWWQRREKVKGESVNPPKNYAFAMQEILWLLNQSLLKRKSNGLNHRGANLS
jgi:hypothetical protein